MLTSYYNYERKEKTQMNNENYQKPDYIQNYSSVCKEILQVLNKYEITYVGLINILDAIKNEIDCYTYITVNPDIVDSD